MAFRDIEIVYRPVKSCCCCQREKSMVNTRSNGESASDKFTGLREVAKFCKFPRLKTIGDLEVQMFQLWSIAGLLHSEKIMKIFQYLQIKPEDTFLDILPVIQKFEQIVQSVNKQLPLTKVVANGRKIFRRRRKQPNVHNFYTFVEIVEEHMNGCQVWRLLKAVRNERNLNLSRKHAVYEKISWRLWSKN